MISEITNAAEADFYTRTTCAEHFNVLNFGLRQVIAKKENRLEEEVEHQRQLTAIYEAEKSEWRKEFFRTNFPQFLNCHIGKVVMGVIKEDNQDYHYRTNEF